MIPFPECIGFRLVFYTRRNAVNVTKKITNYFSHIESLGVQVRNMKMDFNTGGTWRQVRQ